MRRSHARLMPYAWLAKWDVRGHLLIVPIAASALTASQLAQGWMSVVLAVPAAWSVFVVTASLDDVQGLRDGSDTLNYTRGSPRKQARKPLLSGALNISQALRFASIIGLLGLTCLIVAFLLSPTRAVWFLPACLGVALLSSQYSSGMRISYRMRGGSELVQFCSTACTALFAYSLIAGRPDSQIVVEAVLIGSWHVLIGVCGNSNDVVGDRHAGRSTLSATLPEHLNRRYVGSIFLAEWLIVAVAFVDNWIPVSMVLALVPSLVLQIRQFAVGVLRADWLTARRLAFQVLYAGASGLLIFNIVANHID